MTKDLEQAAQQSYIPPYWMAALHAGLDHKERAFEWLEKGYDERDTLLAMITTEPIFDRLREEPRFRDLLKKMGLA